MSDRRTVASRLSRAALTECVRHLEAARELRSELAAMTGDPAHRQRLRGECSGLTVAIDHLRTEWELR